MIYAASIGMLILLLLIYAIWWAYHDIDVDE